jgi:hypothetical protein
MIKRLIIFIIVFIIIFRQKILDCGFLIHTKLNKILRYAYIDDKDNSSGYWTDEQRKTHITCNDLIKYLKNFYKENNVESVLDLGCGNCNIVFELKKSNINATGVDYNNLIPEIVKQDLTKPYNNPKDYVQTFEVGEHIPKEHESTFINNITSNAKKGIIMSWAVDGQGGDGHVNERSVDYIKKLIEDKGFKYNSDKTKELRNSIKSNINFLYFRHNLLIFDRIKND